MDRNGAKMLTMDLEPEVAKASYVKCWRGADRQNQGDLCIRSAVFADMSSTSCRRIDALRTLFNLTLKNFVMFREAGLRKFRLAGDVVIQFSIWYSRLLMLFAHWEKSNRKRSRIEKWNKRELQPVSAEVASILTCGMALPCLSSLSCLHE